MPNPNYGVLVGKLVDKLECLSAIQFNPSDEPKFDLLIEAEGIEFRIGVVMGLKKNPENFPIYFCEKFNHPILEGLAHLNHDFYPLEIHPGLQAHDFIRENFFPQDSDHKINLQKIRTESDWDLFFNLNSEQDSRIYVFGSCYKPQPNKESFLGFDTRKSLKDLPFAEINPNPFTSKNSWYEDGAILIHSPDKNQYFALFAKIHIEEIYSDSPLNQFLTGDILDPSHKNFKGFLFPNSGS